MSARQLDSTMSAIPPRLATAPVATDRMTIRWARWADGTLRWVVTASSYCSDYIHGLGSGRGAHGLSHERVSAQSKALATLADLRRELEQLHDAMLAFEAKHADELAGVVACNRASALNLVHYLAMRSHDLRGLQSGLAAMGLSSLGRAESHALSAVEVVLDVVQRLMEGPKAAVGRAAPPCDLQAGAKLLDQHTIALLGPEPHGRSVRVMLTMPTEAASDYSTVRNLLEAGMDCMRINCAHDEPAAWQRMVQHLRRARQASGRRCSVLMDLAGPSASCSIKGRTSPRRCACLTTYSSAWRRINRRKVPCCARCAWQRILMRAHFAAMRAAGKRCATHAAHGIKALRLQALDFPAQFARSP